MDWKLIGFGNFIGFILFYFLMVYTRRNWNLLIFFQMPWNIFLSPLFSIIFTSLDCTSLRQTFWCVYICECVCGGWRTNFTMSVVCICHAEAKFLSTEGGEQHFTIIVCVCLPCHDGNVERFLLRTCLSSVSFVKIIQMSSMLHWNSGG